MDHALKGFAASLAAVTALGLAGCGGSGDGSGSDTGNLTIGLTDGPVEGAEAVVIELAGIEVKAAGSPAETYEISDGCDGDLVSGDSVCSIDLLELQGQNRAVLFSEEVPAGNYERVRLLVNAQPSTIDSYFTPQGTSDMCSLWIPSSAQTGLKLVTNINVAANGVTDFTVDFDVRKSITNPPGLGGVPGSAECTEEYLMKPVLRIVDTGNIGSISGVIETSLLETQVMNAAEETVAACEQDETTMEFINAAVYVFWEDGAQPPPADDIDVDETGQDLGDADPITTATVGFDSSVGADGAYVYEAGFLLAGETYRVALTCDPVADEAGSDDFDPNDPGASDVFRFLAERGDVEVTVNGDADGSLTAADGIGLQ